MAGEVTGMAELSLKLSKLGKALGSKTLRQAAMAATTPVFKEIKAAAPVGKKAHRTHKGRLVAPGFLKRSVKRKSRVKHGRATVTIGVAGEAFYGVQFLDRGTKKISARNWFKKRFILNKPKMERSFKALLKEKIRKAIR